MPQCGICPRGQLHKVQGAKLDALGQRDRDRPLVFERPAGANDRHADELAGGVEAQRVPLRGGIEIDRGAWVGAVQVEHVTAGVVVDAIEGEVADLYAHGSLRRPNAVTMNPRLPS
jgi:hypothetical protein